jgi:hypothetical protein
MTSWWRGRMRKTRQSLLFVVTWWQSVTVTGFSFKPVISPESSIKKDDLWLPLTYVIKNSRLNHIAILAGGGPPLFVLCSLVIAFAGHRRNNKSGLSGRPFWVEDSREKQDLLNLILPPTKKKDKKRRRKSPGNQSCVVDPRVSLFDTEIGTKRCPLLWAVVMDWLYRAGCYW